MKYLLAESQGDDVDEREWTTCDNPDWMLGLLARRGAASDRKLRLFACGWGRTQADFLLEEGLQAIAVSELYAEGLAGEAEVRAAREAAKRPDLALGYASYFRTPEVQRALRAAVLIAWGKTSSSRAIRQVADYIHELCDHSGDHRAAVQWALLVRDIFPNPFSPPPSLGPEVLGWNDGILKRLAEAAYENRLLPSGHLDPERLGVLADAMEEARADAEMVGHLRGPGPHWRGCFAVDLCLGRS